MTTTELLEVPKPCKFVSEYQAKLKAAAKKGSTRLPFAERFTLALFEFLPDPHPRMREHVQTWVPSHPLDIPPPKLRKASSFDEISFTDGEQVFLTRADVLDTAADWNRDTLAMLSESDGIHALCWMIAIELTVPKAGIQFANVDWQTGMWDIHNLMFEIVKPSADELVKFSK